MKECMYCGHEMEDNELVCSNCHREQRTVEEETISVKVERIQRENNVNTNNSFKQLYSHNNNVSNLSGWWCGFFFGWFGVAMIYLSNTGKPYKYQRPYGGAVFWAIVSTILEIWAVIQILPRY